MRRWIALAAVAGVAIGAASGAHAASTAQTVSAIVPSSTQIGVSSCAPGTPSMTDLGVIPAGSAAVSTTDCAIDFGSSNDSSMLWLAQDDGGGVAMRWRSPTPLGDWPFNGSAADISAFAASGTLLGSPAFGAGPPGFGQAVTLDGVDDSVSVPSAPHYDVGSNFTVDLWFRTTDISNFPYAILVERANSCGTDCQFMATFRRADSALNFGTSTAGSSNLISVPGAAYVDGAWHHLAATVGADLVMRLYVDGVEQGTQLIAGPVDMPPVPITVGMERAVASNRFTGDIDEVRMSTPALSGDEVRQAYSVRLADYGGPAADWGSANAAFFAACLSSAQGGAATDASTWSASAGCPQNDVGQWRAVPGVLGTAGSKVALRATPGSGSAHLRFAARMAANQAPGAYTARLVVQTVAPNIP